MPVFAVKTGLVGASPIISYTLLPKVVELLKNLTVLPPFIVIVAL